MFAQLLNEAIFQATVLKKKAESNTVMSNPDNNDNVGSRAIDESSD